MPALIPVVLLAAVLTASADSGAIIMPEDATVEVAAGDQIELPLTDLVTGASAPVFGPDQVRVTSGDCLAQPGGGWDSVVVAVPSTAVGSCTVDYAPYDAATGAAAAEPGTITVTVVPAAGDEPAADVDGSLPDPSTTTTAAAEDTTAYSDGESASAPSGHAGDELSAAADEVLSVTVTLRRDEAPLVGGITAVLVAVGLIASRVRRRRRDRQVLVSATPTALAEPTPAPIPNPEEREW